MWGNAGGGGRGRGNNEDMRCAFLMCRSGLSLNYQWFSFEIYLSD